jgi:hypothetical protein
MLPKIETQQLKLYMGRPAWYWKRANEFRVQSTVFSLFYLCQAAQQQSTRWLNPVQEAHSLQLACLPYSCKCISQDASVTFTSSLAERIRTCKTRLVYRGRVSGRNGARAASQHDEIQGTAPWNHPLSQVPCSPPPYAAPCEQQRVCLRRYQHCIDLVQQALTDRHVCPHNLP